MKCIHCGFENDIGTKFCGNCGSLIAAPRTIPSSTIPVQQLKCNKCGVSNPAGSLYCDNCGTKLSEPVTAAAAVTGSKPSQVTHEKTSAAWWLLPIFLFWLGGLIGWLAVKNRDKSKAAKLLWTGIVLTILWIIAMIAISAAIVKSITFF